MEMPNGCWAEGILRDIASEQDDGVFETGPKKPFRLDIIFCRFTDGLGFICLWIKVRINRRTP